MSPCRTLTRYGMLMVCPRGRGAHDHDRGALAIETRRKLLLQIPRQPLGHGSIIDRLAASGKPEKISFAGLAEEHSTAAPRFPERSFRSEVPSRSGTLMPPSDGMVMTAASNDGSGESGTTSEGAEGRRRLDPLHREA